MNRSGLGATVLAIGLGFTLAGCSGGEPDAPPAGKMEPGKMEPGKMKGDGGKMEPEPK